MATRGLTDALAERPVRESYGDGVVTGHAASGSGSRGLGNTSVRSLAKYARISAEAWAGGRPNATPPDAELEAGDDRPGLIPQG